MELDRHRFRLAYRPPYDWDAVMHFLAARATPGVESVDANGYRRTIASDGVSGTIAVSAATDGAALILEVRGDALRARFTIVELVGRMFDLGADPVLIASTLSTDRLLKRPLKAHAGVRVPGAWDPFELTVRAIVGQQISVAAATTMAGRIAMRWGTAVDAAPPLTHLFPTPEQLADAPIEEAGIIASRAATLRALARAVIDKRVCFDNENTLSSLLSIRGIGHWTAQYVAMRALQDPDAFPTGDLVLRRMAGGLSARELDRRSDAWRPWRAYAVMLLWQAARDLDEKRRRHQYATRDHARPVRSRRPGRGHHAGA